MNLRHGAYETPALPLSYTADPKECRAVSAGILPDRPMSCPKTRPSAAPLAGIAPAVCSDRTRCGPWRKTSSERNRGLGAPLAHRQTTLRGVLRAGRVLAVEGRRRLVGIGNARPRRYGGVARSGRSRNGIAQRGCSVPRFNPAREGHYRDGSSSDRAFQERASSSLAPTGAAEPTIGAW